MTGFAHRLVARSAGRPTGLPLLMPRPASRFETSEAPELDEVTETRAPAQISRPSSDLSDARIAERPQGRPAESPGVEPPQDEGSMTAQRLQSDVPPPRGKTAPPDQILPPASSQSPERVHVEPQQRGHPARETPVPANISRMAERFAALADQAMATPPPPSMTADAARAERPATPQISIGRIEVQFLAPEKPTAAPRAEPQPTRGFDAYARARRGMPR